MGIDVIACGSARRYGISDAANQHFGVCANQLSTHKMTVRIQMLTPLDANRPSQKTRNTEALTFWSMPSQPSLLDLFHNKKGRLPVFRRQTEANILEHLSGNSISCESKQEANDFVAFTERYADVDLLDDDTPANRNGIISTLRKQALTTLREKSIGALAKPCVKVEVHLDTSKAAFTLTTSLYFFNPNKEVL